MNTIAELQKSNFLHPGPLQPDGKSIFPPDFSIFKGGENPNTANYTFEPLYKQSDSTGKWSIWQIGHNSGTSRNYVISGQLGGTLRIYPKLVKAKRNKSLFEQSISDAKSVYNKKYDEGRRPAGVNAPDLFYPMLAKEYDVSKIVKWPVSAQPKIDGIRAYAGLDSSVSSGVSLQSRNHKEFSWLDHIRIQLKPFLELFPPGTILDGELYINRAGFQTISSIVSSKNTMHPNNPQIQYYIFDIWLPNNPVWEDRFNILVQGFIQLIQNGKPTNTLIIIPQIMMFSNDQVFNMRDQYLTQGFEGIMIRPYAGSCGGNIRVENIQNLNGTYSQQYICDLDASQRTTTSITESQYHQSKSAGSRKVNLMKLKKFHDEEGVVVDIVSGEGTKEGLAILVLQDPRGHIFRHSPAGIAENHKEWLQNKQNYIGRLYNYEYQNLTDDGLPRFPSGGKGFIQRS